MESSEKPLGMEYIVLAVLLAAGLGFFFMSSGQEVRFCRRVFGGLVKGEPNVGGSIAWDRLKALDLDLGSAYAKLPPGERQKFQQAFIQNFAVGFRQGQGQLMAFTNWRMEHDGSVAVDYPAKHKTLLFRVSETGKRQLEGIAWKQ